MLLVIVAFVALVVISVFLFLREPQFGKAASGERLQRIEQSPHFKNGQFQNLSSTPAITEGVSYFTVLKEFFFRKSKRGKPAVALPSKTIDLSTLRRNEDVLVWFGHSSYFMQID